MNYKQTITALNYNITLSFRAEKNRDSLMYGMGNRCKNGYILFLDYDDTPIEWIMDEINLLHSKYLNALSNAYLFKTKNGIHVVFLNKNSLGNVIEMLKMSSCDKRYIDIPMKYARRVWVLRQNNKKDENTIEYLGTIKNPYVKNNRSFLEHSTPHKKWMIAHYNIPPKDFPKNYRWDNEKTLVVGYYHIAE